MKGVLTILFMMFFVGSMTAQTKDVEIKTSAECGDCKVRIEDKLNYTKGVRFAELDVPTKVVTVRYNEKKISLEEVKEAIAEVGYDADEVKAKTDAVKALPACCRPGGMKGK